MTKHEKKKIVAKAFFIVMFGVFFAHYISDIAKIESYAIDNGFFGMVILFLFYFLMMVLTLIGYKWVEGKWFKK